MLIKSNVYLSYQGPKGSISSNSCNEIHTHYKKLIFSDDNMSDRSDHSKSTSGCSSMIPHPPSTVLKDRVTLELNESDIDSIKDKLVDSSDKLPNSMFI